jgi:hypothetical protein
MNREEVVTALEALADELDESGIDGEMYVVGGAAIAIAFDARRSTRDIDAVFEPKAAIYAAAERVAERRGLPAGWLNDGVKGFLAGPDPCAAPVLERPGLRVLVASPRILLALKVVALLHLRGVRGQALCALDPSAGSVTEQRASPAGGNPSQSRGYRS